MAMVGRGGAVHIGADKVLGITNWQMDAGAGEIDVTDFDSGGWEEFLAGLKGWSGSFEGNFMPTDTTGQRALIDAWLAGNTVMLELRIDATRRFTGTALVKFNIEMPVDDKGSFSCDYKGTGVLTVTLT